MNKIKCLKSKIKKLSKYLLADIIEYKNETLKSYNPLYLVAYRTNENIFQDIEQMSFYKTKEYLFNDFYIKYYEKYCSNQLYKDIIIDAANIIKFLWKDGSGNPLPPEEHYTVSLQEIERELNEFFKIVFYSVFFYSYKYNNFIDKLSYDEVINNIEFYNEESYIKQLHPLYLKYNIENLSEEDIKQKDKIFYNNAIKYIIDNLFYLEEKNVIPIQKHNYYLRGIKLNRFEYNVNTKIKIRNIKLYEMERCNLKWGGANETCIIEHKYKLTNLDTIFLKPLLMPIAIKLVFKNCAMLTKTNNYLSCVADGMEDKVVYNTEYDGGIPIILETGFFTNFNYVVNLCQHYIENIENEDYLFIKIAIDFYTQAVDKLHPSHQITYCCLALEALYNTSSEKIIKQITERCSEMLVPIMNVLPKTIVKNLKKAYDIRCSYVHAQNPKCSIDDDLSSIIFDYTRYSILIFIILIKSSNFYKKYLKRAPNLTFKKYVNEYYLNNINLMQDIKQEFAKSLKNCTWINELNIKKDFYRYRKYMLD